MITHVWTHVRNLHNVTYNNNLKCNENITQTKNIFNCARKCAYDVNVSEVTTFKKINEI